MPNRLKVVPCAGFALLLLSFATAAYLIPRGVFPRRLRTTQQRQQTTSEARFTSLSLQPEAFRLSRQLGNRFSASRRAVTTMEGNLTIGPNEQTVTILRRQTERGETFEFISRGRRLRWSADDGVTALSGIVPTQAERLLVERLAFDSPDQFVLAQLRGASYYTVTHNARPDDVGASDNYRGPTWDVIRVTDPEQDVRKRPLSPWRLYYINSNSGLIDKIVCETLDERVEVIFSDWIVIAGEKVPSRIRWKQQAQTIMEFALTTFTRLSEQ